MQQEMPKTLGFLFADWIAWHCVVPNGFDLGKPFELVGWQLDNAIDFYRVKPDAVYDPARPRQAAAFKWRRGQIVGGQKLGKSPFGAAVAAFEGVGPCVFCGWAKGGEVFRCSDWGCSCGFEYEYSAGEPMGMPRRTALIQLLATSEEQTANVYRPLQSMVRNGRLSDLMKVREGFIRLPNGGRIDPVTASAHSKLGNPVNFVLGDESGIWTRRSGMFEVGDTVMRGAMAMDGRMLELTNPWDPMDASFGQMTYESTASDIMKFFPKHDPSLDFANPQDRRKILEFVYSGSPWVPLDQVEATASELMARDPAQARRFYGCEIVQGLGSYMPEPLYMARWLTVSRLSRVLRFVSVSTVRNPVTGRHCVRKRWTGGVGRRPMARPAGRLIGILSNGRGAFLAVRWMPVSPNCSISIRCADSTATRIRGRRRLMLGRTSMVRILWCRGRRTE